MSNRLYSIAETAAEWGVSKDTVRRLLGCGKVRSVRIQRRVMIPAEEVLRICAEGTGGRAADAAEELTQRGAAFE